MHTSVLYYRQLTKQTQTERDEMTNQFKKDDQITINNINYNIIKVIKITRKNIRKYARATLYLQRGNTGTNLHEAYIRNDNNVTNPIRTGVKLSELQ